MGEKEGDAAETPFNTWEEEWEEGEEKGFPDQQEAWR